MIYYNGVGSKIDGRHSQKEFLRICCNEFPEMVALKFKGVPLDPEKIRKNDLARWMEFTGATFIR